MEIWTDESKYYGRVKNIKREISFVRISWNVCVVGPPPVSSGFTLYFSYWQRAGQRTPTPVNTRELFISQKF